MKEQATNKSLLYKLEGYYLIPHELLHVLAYRLIGKPCRYRWGWHRVNSSAKMSLGEELFVSLLPLAVCATLGFFFYFLWTILALATGMLPETYLAQGPRWHFSIFILANLFILYSGTAYRDIRWVIRLLSSKDQPRHKSNQPQKQPRKQK